MEKENSAQITVCLAICIGFRKKGGIDTNKNSLNVKKISQKRSKVIKKLISHVRMENNIRQGDWTLFFEG